jgi:hypothetical protein
MKLGISSAAVSELSLEELTEACVRRGLETIEIVLGQRHREVDQEGLPRGAAGIAGLLWEDREGKGIGDALKLAAAAGVPLVVPASELVLGALRESEPSIARLLLLHESHSAPVDSLLDLIEELNTGDRNVELGWQVDPRVDDPARVESFLSHAGERVRYVRLLGGGPEALEQTGQGIGNLIGRLALLRFDGPLILTPSGPARLRAWAHWLGRRAGWGCGSKLGDPSLLCQLTR